MQTYYAIVHQEGDSAFGISFPDLEGCFSAADTEAEIMTQAQDALALYFDEASSSPRASTIAELRRNPEVADDLAAGAFLLAVPFIRTARKSRYNVVLDTSLVEGIDRAAEAVGVSRSEFIARAASRSLRDTTGAVVHAERRRAASKDAKVMKDPKASKEAKTAAASALTQKVKKK